MLSKVISYIDSAISNISIAKNPYGLVDRVRSDGKEFPAVYCKNEWTPLTDFVNGFSYHRIIGSISSADLDSEEAVSCEAYEVKTYPMRYVFSRLKSDFDNDVFLPERIINDITNTLKLKNSKSLCIELGCDVITIQPISGEQNIYNAYNSEYSGTQEIPLNCILVYVDYRIIIQGAVSCFEKICTTSATV